MRKLLAWGSLVVASALALGNGGLGCGGSSKSSGFTPGDDSGVDASGNDAAIPQDANGADVPNILGDGSSMTCTTLSCSSDLHDVLCNGTVYQTCPADQGCAGGKCVPACQAAQASKSSIGCDYYSVNPDTTFAAGACFAAFVANTWTGPVTINVDYGGMALDATAFARVPTGTGQSITYAPLTNGQLQPGQIAVLFLAQFGAAAIYKPACPTGITPGISAMDAAPHGTSIGTAFHISTTAPVVAYDIFPYGGGVSAITSATLLLPTTVWDTNYIAVDAYEPPTGGSGDSNNPLLDIVASANNTHVTIAPTAAITAGTGVAGAAQGMATTYTLQKGQILHFNQGAELIGSPIQSDNPVGVWGGNACMDVPVGTAACDAAHQQIPPVKALGNEYVAVRYRNRFNGMEESVPWRLVGAVAGTTLSYEPSPPTGAPTTLTVGQMVEFTTNGPFVVRSQDAMHPFYLAGYMTGGEAVDPTGAEGRGDPEFVNVLPPQQYLSDYVFFTDPTYPETDLVLVRAQASDGTFKDVTLDCLGTTPISGWMPVGTSGKYEYTRVDLVTGNFMPVSTCNNGRHEMTSKGPFGVTVWGWGSAATGGSLDPTQPMSGFYSQWVSYAYPAGASVQPINTVVVPPMNQ